MNNLIVQSPSAYNYPLLVKQLFLSPAAWHPDREIVYRDQRRITYRLWKERVGRLIGALRALGIKEGDTVGVLDWDSHRYLECYYAIPMMGAVLHTINVRLSLEQLVYTMSHAEDKVLIVHSDFIPLLEQIKGRLDTVEHFILIDDDMKGVQSLINFAGEYEELLDKAETVKEFPEFDENTRATTFYTTGTTGLPKGVYFSHRQLVLHTLATMCALGTSSEQGRFHSEDTYMPLTPMFHVHAWGIPYIATMLGVKQVYPGKYVPAMLLQLLISEKVTFSHCVPTILAMLLRDPSASELDLSHWTCIIGGAALPRQIALEALKRNIDVFVGYGMSETCPVLTLSHLEKADLDLSDDEQSYLRCRTGRPIPMVQVKVLDAQGREVEQNDRSPGEILVRAPWLSQGYHKDHSNSERLWEGGWLHTNDVACVDASGSVRITDRTKDVIKVGGEWLSSLEIEDLISAQNGVAEVAVLGKADERWGEIPLALVVAKPGFQIDPKDLASQVRKSVDSGILPREAILIQVKLVESLVKTSVGKTNKLLLREKYL